MNTHLIGQLPNNATKSFSSSFFLLFLVQSLYFSFSTHKQRTPIRFYTTPLLCLPKKPDTLAGFEPGSSVPKAKTMSTAPRRQGKKVS
jgi:hypothetical protein